MTKQQKLLKSYRLYMDAGAAQLDLAVTYYEDGAPGSAALCADTAAVFFRKAELAKATALGTPKTLDSVPEKR